MNQETTVRHSHRPASGRHPVNVGHLVMGLAFVGLVAVWALVRSDLVDGHDVRWLLPVPWVVAGAAGLLATTVSGRRRWGARRSGSVTPADSVDAPTTTEPTNEEDR